MVVEVLVHSCGPLVRRDGTEKGMRVPGALCFPAVMKLLHSRFQLTLFQSKISLINNYKLLVGGTIFPKGFFVGEYGPRQRPKYPAD